MRKASAKYHAAVDTMAEAMKAHHTGRAVKAFIRKAAWSSDDHPRDDLITKAFAFEADVLSLANEMAAEIEAES